MLGNIYKLIKKKYLTEFESHKKLNNLTSKETHELFNELGEFYTKQNHIALADAKVQVKFFIKLN